MIGRGPQNPIGLFDSGVGGLTVLRQIQKLLPQEDLIYIADQARVPYGPRPEAEVREYAREITAYLLGQNAKLIVVACNTATAAALNYLRHTFPKVPFVGMEPAVKPGAAQTRSGKVGVLATAGTFESQRYASLMERFARHVQLYENPCLGLVELIEAGRFNGTETESLLHDCVQPMLTAGVDTLVLGCTHYPFVLPVLARITGPDVAIIDPAPAVARQTGRLLQQHHLANNKTSTGQVRLLTSGEPGRFAAQVSQLLHQEIPVEPFHNSKPGTDLR